MRYLGECEYCGEELTVERIGGVERHTRGEMVVCDNEDCPGEDAV
jgi:hypothetical protein